MKRLCLALLAALLLLSSCGGENQKISDDEIKRLVDLDIQLVKYQEVECPNYDFNNPITHDGKEYYPIVDERFDEWSEWEAYVKSAYTDDFAAEYLTNEWASVVNVDGKTCCEGGGGRGYDLTDKYTYEILKNENGSAEVLVKNPSVWNDENPEEAYYNVVTYLFVYNDGEWKISGYGNGKTE